MPHPIFKDSEGLKRQILEMKPQPIIFVTIPTMTNSAEKPSTGTISESEMSVLIPILAKKTGPNSI